MSDAVATQPSTPPGQSDPPTPPPEVVPKATLGLFVAVLCTLAAVSALGSLARMLPGAGQGVTLLLVVLALAAALPLVPALRAFLPARRRNQLLAKEDLPAARQAAANGRELSHTAMGYALAVLICAALVWFATANDGAISQTFLRWEFIQVAWQHVTSAFLVNVKVALGAEALVLMFGLLIAVMRLLPGRAGRPLRWIAIGYVDTFRPSRASSCSIWSGSAFPWLRCPS